MNRSPISSQTDPSFSDRRTPPSSGHRHRSDNRGTRRDFLIRTAAGAFAYAALRDDALARVLAADRDARGATPDRLVDDERFWGRIQAAFAVDRSVINLNNGGVNPAPRIVMDAMRRHLEFTNQIPSRNLWRIQDKQVETVRRRIARTFGCDAEEIAVVRNASEAMEIALYGLDLGPGDEILTTDQDYPRMINTLKQRELREGIVLKTFPFPNPPPSLDFLVEKFKDNITPRTRAVLMSHMTTFTGQIFPVREICRVARDRGITAIVDGAHAFGHFVFDGADIGCDFYGTSLHKWLHAPIGTGFLYVRRDRIAGHWPLMAAPQPKSEDIRKFEEIGTHPDANRLAVAEAFTFYEGIGPARKEARLRWLRDRFARRLAGRDRVTLYTSLDPRQSCAMATLGIDGIEPADLATHLWRRHKVFVTGINHQHIKGIRVSPNVYTTPTEIDIFSDAIEHVIKNGLPTT